MRGCKTWAGAGLVLCLAYGAAAADALKFTVDLTPDQQGKPGKGTATLAVDTASKTLTGTIAYSGLSAPPAVAAIEGPPPQANAPPVTLPIQLPANPASPIRVSIKLTDAAIAGLKSGEWVLLLGNKQAPEIGGEIRPGP